MRSIREVSFQLHARPTSGYVPAQLVFSTYARIEMIECNPVAYKAGSGFKLFAMSEE